LQLSCKTFRLWGRQDGGGLAESSLVVARFSTGDFPEAARLTACREMFGRIGCRTEIEPLTESFSCDTTMVMLPSLGIVSDTCSAVRFNHTRQALEDSLSFMTASPASWAISHIGREQTLHAGDGILLSNAAPGTLTLPTTTRFINFRLPTDALAPLVTDLGAALAQPIPEQSVALRLLKSYLGILHDAQALATPALQQLAATHIIDLLALSLGATRDAADLANGRGMRAARLSAIKADVNASLGDQDLSIRAISARHKITPVYVRKLFEGEGITFSEYVLAQRLVRAHRLLSDPRFSERAISAIAFMCGFGDLSYFNRAFRRRYGATPSDVRTRAAGSSRCKRNPG
jgi:AraC-like DNA-binding protein